MSIARSMAVNEVIAQAEIFSSGKRLDRFVLANEDLEEVTWEIEVLSFSPGRPGNFGDWPGEPPEPAEFEIDMGPDEVAGMVIKLVVPKLDDDEVNPKLLDKLWQEIWRIENNWQHLNLDDAVWEEMNSREERL